MTKKICLKNTDTVLFDMDGVITNTMPYHFKAWSRVFASVDLHVSRHEIYCREGQQGSKTVEELFAEHQIPFSQARAERLLKAKEALFKKIFKRRFVTGARTFLRGLSKRNYRLALVTGTSRHELLEILPERIRSLFHVIVSGNDVRQGKPHPEPYLKALKSLSARPGQAVVIENAPFGIRSAKAAKLTCLAIETSLNREFLSEADAVYSSFKDLRQSTHL